MSESNYTDAEILISTQVAYLDFDDEAKQLGKGYG